MIHREIAGSAHWVFDLDGTLTVPVHDFGAIRLELGVPEGCDILDHLASVPAAEAAVLHLRLRSIEDDLLLRTEVARGAGLLLDGLRRRGVRCGVLTRNSRVTALRTLEAIGLEGSFAEEDVLGRDEARPKPDPEGILALARRWGTETGRMVMVGDYLYDLQAGRSAGASTVHVERYPEPRWPDLADLVVADLEELAVFVEGDCFDGTCFNAVREGGEGRWP